MVHKKALSRVGMGSSAPDPRWATLQGKGAHQVESVRWATCEGSAGGFIFLKTLNPKRLWIVCPQEPKELKMKHESKVVASRQSSAHFTKPLFQHWKPGKQPKMWWNYLFLWKARILNQGSTGLIINNYENIPST